MPGLLEKDFRLTDNGRLQKLTLDSDADTIPISLVVAVQTNEEVRDYLGFIEETGALLDNSLAASTGETALITYNDKVTIVKQFADGDLQNSLETLSPSGDAAKMTDAGIRGIELLKQQSRSQSRILLFIGQPVENGGQGKIELLEHMAEQENVQIYALTLPVINKRFISDSFSLQGFGS